MASIEVILRRFDGPPLNWSTTISSDESPVDLGHPLCDALYVLIEGYNALAEAKSNHGLALPTDEEVLAAVGRTLPNLGFDANLVPRQSAGVPIEPGVFEIAFWTLSPRRSSILGF